MSRSSITFFYQTDEVYEEITRRSNRRGLPFSSRAVSHSLEGLAFSVMTTTSSWRPGRSRSRSWTIMTIPDRRSIASSSRLKMQDTWFFLAGFQFDSKMRERQSGWDFVRQERPFFIRNTRILQPFFKNWFRGDAKTFFSSRWRRGSIIQTVKTYPVASVHVHASTAASTGRASTVRRGVHGQRTRSWSGSPLQHGQGTGQVGTTSTQNVAKNVAGQRQLTHVWSARSTAAVRSW